MNHTVLWEKNRRLGLLLAPLPSVMVAFSGGVDSGFLLYRAKQELGSRAQACLVVSESLPPGEREEANSFVHSLGGELHELKVSELNEPLIADNPLDRCYHCKTLSFRQIKVKALALGVQHLIAGVNFDDLKDYRPGIAAGREQGVAYPLAEVGLTKAEIRLLAQQAGLTLWNKPSSPCLNSRIPFGEPITQEKLRQIAHGELLLRSFGLQEFRLRHHGELARIEVDPSDFSQVLEHREALLIGIKALGFTRVTLDLAGFRSGSLNPAIL